MRFSISSAFLPVDELTPIARAADELGYDSMTIPDHVVDLEEIQTPYPYTRDGSRRWTSSAHWPDPWVLAGSLAAVTTRLRFVTSVYVPALRNPFQVAKSVGTAAVLSGNRVALGVGVGWCAEEFELMGQDFRGRGRRTDEVLELLSRLWEPGVTEFKGAFYSAPRLTMEPTPTQQVPIYVGGLSETGLARAARHDGWVGDMFTTDEAISWVDRLRAKGAGAERPFSVFVALTDAIAPEDYRRAEAGGVTDVMTMPWAFYTGLEANLDQKLDGLRRFSEDVIRPLSAL